MRTWEVDKFQHSANGKFLLQATWPQPPGLVPPHGLPCNAACPPTKILRRLWRVRWTPSRCRWKWRRAPRRALRRYGGCCGAWAAGTRSTGGCRTIPRSSGTKGLSTSDGPKPSPVFGRGCFCGCKRDATRAIAMMAMLSAPVWSQETDATKAICGRMQDLF